MNHWPIKISLFINYFLFAILLNSVGTVILQVQNTLGVSESAAGVLEAFKDLPIAIASFFIAAYAARIGYRKTMLAALAFVTVACFIMARIPTFWMSKLLFATAGVSFAMIKVSVFATIGLVTRDDREHASLMNFLESFFMVGVMAGYFLFSAFVDNADPSSSAWVRVYDVLGAMAAAALVLLLMARLDETAVRQSVATSEQNDIVRMIRLRARPLVLIFIVSAFLYVLIEQSIMSWLPTFNSRILNLSPSLSIQMASILAASTALGRFAAGVALRHFDWLKVLMIGLSAAAVLVLATLPLTGQAPILPIASWTDAPLAAFVFPLIGFCIAPVYPAINSTILSALPKVHHAPMAGLIVIFSALGGTTGSIITGRLFESLGGREAFYCSLIPIALLMIALLGFKRRTRQPNSGQESTA